MFSSTSRKFTLAILFVGLFALLLGGCAPSRTFVLSEPLPGTIHSGLTIKPLDSTIKVDPQSQSDFEARLSRKLKDQIGVEPSDHGDLVVEYRFTLFDQGAGAARVTSSLANIVGSPFYGLGDGAIGVEVVYSRSDGTTLGHIVTDGSISGAFGTTSGALDDAATSIAKYTKAHFMCPTCGTLGIKVADAAPVHGLRNE